MEAYKFKTTVQKDGTIQIPEISGLANRRVELFIVVERPEQEQEGAVGHDTDRFLDKWTGVLEGLDADRLKQDYLLEKHA